jgi:lipopolysaccharide transport system permease protein
MLKANGMKHHRPRISPKDLYSSGPNGVLPIVSQSNTATWSEHHPFAFIGALWRNRNLVKQFTLRNVELRHKGSRLGLVWSLLNPLLTLALYVFVFGYIQRGRFGTLANETRLDYALGIFVGLIVFHLFAEVLATAPTVIMANPNFVKKVVFPLEILPAASVGASVVHMLSSLVLALLGIAALGPGLSAHVFWVPLILLPLILLLLGMAWFFAAVGVFFRDISQIVGLLSMGLMFASAVFYSASTLPPTAWAILRFNPMLLAIELMRDATMWDQPMKFLHLGYLMVFGAISAVIGYFSFRKMAPAFADVL